MPLLRSRRYGPCVPDDVTGPRRGRPDMELIDLPLDLFCAGYTVLYGME